MSKVELQWINVPTNTLKKVESIFTWFIKKHKNKYVMGNLIGLRIIKTNDEKSYLNLNPNIEHRTKTNHKKLKTLTQSVQKKNVNKFLL
jgi:hypothetical protein